MIARKTKPTDFGVRVRVFSAMYNIPIKKMTRELGLSYAHVLSVMKGERPGYEVKRIMTEYMEKREAQSEEV